MSVPERPDDGQRPEAGNVSHLIVLGHPAASSFNHAIVSRYAATVAENFQDVIVRDLYAMGFDPLLKDDERPEQLSDGPRADIAAELELIARCDVVTFVYPLWFGSPPAIVKGYIDRVFGAVFGFGDLQLGESSRPFAGKTLGLFTSSATSKPWLNEQGLMVSLRQSQGAYLEQLFGFAGACYCHSEQVVEDLSPSRAEKILFDVGEKAREVCAQAAAARHHGAISAAAAPS